jgi:hypothetical protein
MSHCTSFQMRFKDRRTLYKAMRNLQLKPENAVWNRYDTHAEKMLGINGEFVGRLLTGVQENMHVLFVETPEGLQPFFESSHLSEAQLNEQGARLLEKLRTEYVRCSVSDYADLLREKGLFVSVRENSLQNTHSFIISIDGTDKAIQLTLNQEGNIEERVAGIAGRSCVEFTERSWTHEYNALVEDKIVQVLRYRSN